MSFATFEEKKKMGREACAKWIINTEQCLSVSFKMKTLVWSVLFRAERQITTRLKVNILLVGNGRQGMQKDLLLSNIYFKVPTNFGSRILSQSLALLMEERKQQQLIQHLGETFVHQIIILQSQIISLASKDESAECKHVLTGLLCEHERRVKRAISH